MDKSRLNEFEEQLRHSLEGQEVSYNPAHWEEMNAHLDGLQADPFEEQIRETLENQQVPYNPAHWQEMDARLDGLQADPFEEQIRETLENQQVPYNPAHWQELDARLDGLRTDPFENQIKDSLEGIRIPYNPLHWTELAATLDAAEGITSDKTSSRKKAAWWVGAAAVVTVAAGGWWLLNDSNQEPLSDAPVITEVEKTAPTTTPVVTQEEDQVKPVQATPTSPEQPAQDLATPANDQPEVVTPQPSEPAEQSQTQPQEIQSDPVPSIVVNEPAQTVTPETVDVSSEPVNTDPVVIDQPAQQPTSEIVNLAYLADKNVVCPRESVSLALTDQNVTGEFHWDFGDGTFSSLKNPVHRFQKDGVYSITLQVTTDNGETINGPTTVIKVKEAPEVNFAYQTPDNLLANPFTALEAQSEKATHWSWELDGTQLEGQASVRHLFNKKGIYPVNLTVTADNGCSATVTRNVDVPSDYNLLAPNVFSPNGDGVNSTWFPVALMENNYPFTINIYDRSRFLIYTTTNQQIPWDGRVGGQLAQPGQVFVWMAQVELEDGAAPTIFSGTITIPKTR